MEILHSCSFACRLVLLSADDCIAAAAARNVILQADIARGIDSREEGILGAQASLIQHLSTPGMSLPGVDWPC